MLEFKPRLTPYEMIEAGVFGGAYFSPNAGPVVKSEIDFKLFEGLDKNLYEKDKYSPKLNKFKTRSGLNFEQWTGYNWMHKDDPYGWFEWYCKYYSGRRHEDDNRQIKRWQDISGPNGRWRKRIYGMIHETGNWNSSPRIQQTLLHWSYMVNELDYTFWCKQNNKVAPEEWCEYGGLPSPSFYE